MMVPETLDAVKRKHRQLYDALLDKQTETGVLAEVLDQNFVREVNEVLTAVQRLSSQIKSPSDYTWLINASLQWQIAFSTLAETLRPRDISIPDPPQCVSIPQARSSDDEIQAWIMSNAGWISVVRRAKAAESLLTRLSTEAEKNSDWYQAEVYFCENVLSGRYDFVNKVHHFSFYHLTNVWLRDVLQVKAYLLWEQRKDEQPQNAETERGNYLDACEFYRKRLADQSIKAPAAAFGYIHTYLTENVFGSSPTDLPVARIWSLIARKASQYVLAGRSAGDVQNWLDAESFVRGFYGNIVAAVVDGDQYSKDRVREAILQSEGKNSRLSIMNAFEAAIAIYFLRNFESFTGDWKQ